MLESELAELANKVVSRKNEDTYVELKAAKRGPQPNCTIPYPPSRTPTAG